MCNKIFSFKFSWRFYILKDSLNFYSTTDIYHSFILIANLLSHFTDFLALTIVKRDTELTTHLLPVRSLRVSEDKTLLPLHDSMAFFSYGAAAQRGPWPPHS